MRQLFHCLQWYALAKGLTYTNFKTDFRKLSFEECLLKCCSFVPESPRWLTVNEKYDDAVIIINKISAVNEKSLPDDFDIYKIESASKHIFFQKTSNVSKSFVFPTFLLAIVYDFMKLLMMMEIDYDVELNKLRNKLVWGRVSHHQKLAPKFSGIDSCL